jgi:transcriptional regulator with XRE-family HTH domain
LIFVVKKSVFRIQLCAKRKAQMAKDNERKLAETLYVDGNSSQKEIAEQLGVAEKTVSGWKEKYNWDKLRVAKRTTKAEIIDGLYKSVAVIIKRAEDEDKRPLNTVESDQIVKLTRSIEVLEGAESLSNYVYTLTAFLNWVRAVDLDAAKQIAVFSKEFLISKSNGK